MDKRHSVVIIDKNDFLIGAMTSALEATQVFDVIGQAFDGRAVSYPHLDVYKRQIKARIESVLGKAGAFIKKKAPT